MDPRADLRTMATRGWGVSEGTWGRRRLDEGVKQESQKSWHAIAQPGDSENDCVPYLEEREEKHMFSPWRCLGC